MAIVGYNHAQHENRRCALYSMSNLGKLKVLDANAPARRGGATDSEIAEVVTIAAALRAGAAITHGTHAFPGA